MKDQVVLIAELIIAHDILGVKWLGASS